MADHKTGKGIVAEQKLAIDQGLKGKATPLSRKDIHPTCDKSRAPLTGVLQGHADGRADVWVQSCPPCQDVAVWLADHLEQKLGSQHAIRGRCREN